MASALKLSAAEERLNDIRARIGSIAAPLAFVTCLVVPLGLERDAQVMAAICSAVVILWITEAIPLAVAALLGPAAAVLFGVATPNDAFSAFAHPLIFLFLGGFLLARALSVYGIDRRLALWIVSRAWIGGSPRRALIAICGVSFGLSMWISNTATAAMMLPIVTGIMDAMTKSCPDDANIQLRAQRFGEGSLIALAYSASLGGLCTPIGTAPNMIALGVLSTTLDRKLDFLEWMSFGIPTGLLSLVVCIGVALHRFPPPMKHIFGLSSKIRRELSELGPLQLAEKRVLWIFALAIAGWLAPSFFRLSLGEQHPIHLWAADGLAEGNVGLLAALLLFVTPKGEAKAPGKARKALLAWDEVREIDWGTLYLLGGGIALGGLAFKSGLAQAIGEATVKDIGSAGQDPTTALILAAGALVILLTEVTSNTATTNMMLPVLISIAAAAHVDPTRIVLVVALAASFAFMLPVSTPPNAIVYGSGAVRIGSMLRFGAWMDIFGYLILIGVGLFLLPLLGY